MHNFRTYMDLNESLDKPVDFYMTDDTELPRRVYAAFEIDGTNYGISLEESNFDRVYHLKMYRIVNVKPRFWSFMKPSHARKALATLLKFMEAVTPFLKTKMDAIIIPIPSSSASEKYNKFIDRVIRRTYVTTFRQVPVRRVAEKKEAYHHLFIIRKPIQPSAIFRTKQFKKYEFDPSELPAEVADEIEPRRRPRMTVSLATSKNVKFKEFNFSDIEIDDEVFDKVQAVDVKEPSRRSNMDMVKQYETDPLNAMRDVDEYYMVELDKAVAEFDKVTDVIAAVVGVETVKGILAGNDAFDYLKAAFVQNHDAMMPNSIFMQAFTERGAYSTPGHMFTDAQIKEFMKDFEQNVDRYAEFGNEAFSALRSATNYAKGVEREIKYNKERLEQENFEVETFTTDFDVDVLKTSIPGAGKWKYEKVNFNNFGSIGESDEDNYKKANYISDELGYGKAIEAVDESVRQSLYYYTDDGYKVINHDLRMLVNSYFKGDLKDARHWLNRIAETKNVGNIMKVLKELEPLSEPVWVYRGTDMPMDVYETMKVGGDYVDPAFLSTTLKSSMVFKTGTFKVDSGKIAVRSRIYLPKGARVIPTLFYSEHSSENEIILPPMSSLKTVRLDYFTHDADFGIGKQHVALATQVYTGNFYEATMRMILEEAKEMVESFKFGARTVNTVASDKFGGTTDPETLKRINKKIADGEMGKKDN